MMMVQNTIICTGLSRILGFVHFLKQCTCIYCQLSAADTNKDNVHNNGHREKTCPNCRTECLSLVCAIVYGILCDTDAFSTKCNHKKAHD